MPLSLLLWVFAVASIEDLMQMRIERSFLHELRVWRVPDGRGPRPLLDGGGDARRRKLGGEVLCCEHMLDQLVERFSVGAMNVEGALKYFRKVTISAFPNRNTMR